MRVIRESSAAAFAQAAANWMCAHLAAKPDSSLALPTGNTPIGLYAELIERSKTGEVDLAKSHIFNLDEYLGLPACDSHSYAAFLHRHLIAPIGLGPENIRLLGGDASNVDAECTAYDAAVADRGGIDVCILGLGTNGHIAFNEPGSAWDLRTHCVELSAVTRATHGRQASDRWNIPAQGLTMGIRTILEARHVLLLVAGANKQAARQALHRGQFDPRWPVTSLLTHPALTVIELSEPSGHP